METWKTITDYDNYEISDKGRVRNIKTKKILAPGDNGRGRLQVGIIGKDGQKMLQVCRLVAETFIENPENKPTVDHIDFNTKNNCIENLRWATMSEQALHKRVVYNATNISKHGNGYRIQINRNKKRFAKTFTTEAEAIEFLKENKDKIIEQLAEK